jgi:hypothetical protein
LASTGPADLWERFLQVKHQLPDNAGRGGIGTADQLRAHLVRYEKARIDQVMFIRQRGINRPRADLRVAQDLRRARDARVQSARRDARSRKTP